VKRATRPSNLSGNPNAAYMSLEEDVIGESIRNAGKYTPPGATVYISLTRVGDKAEFQVHERGIGIAVSDMANLKSGYRGRGAIRHGLKVTVGACRA